MTSADYITTTGERWKEKPHGFPHLIGADGLALLAEDILAELRALRAQRDTWETHSLDMQRERDQWIEDTKTAMAQRDELLAALEGIYDHGTVSELDIEALLDELRPHVAKEGA